MKKHEVEFVEDALRAINSAKVDAISYKQEVLKRFVNMELESQMNYWDKCRPDEELTVKELVNDTKIKVSDILSIFGWQVSHEVLIGIPRHNENIDDGYEDQNIKEALRRG